MKRPFEFVPRGLTRLVLSIVLAASATQLAKRAGPNVLRDPRAMFGIVSLELAGGSERAAQVLSAWRERSLLDVARDSVRWDYAFIAAYSLLFALLCCIAADAVGERSSLRAEIVAVAWLQLIAGLFDCVENLGLLRMIAGDARPWVPAVTALCAYLKFALLVVGLWHIGVGAFFSLRRRLGRMA